MANIILSNAIFKTGVGDFNILEIHSTNYNPPASDLQNALLQAYDDSSVKNYECFEKFVIDKGYNSSGSEFNINGGFGSGTSTPSAQSYRTIQDFNLTSNFYANGYSGFNKIGRTGLSWGIFYGINNSSSYTYLIVWVVHTSTLNGVIESVQLRSTKLSDTTFKGSARTSIGTMPLVDYLYDDGGGMVILDSEIATDPYNGAGDSTTGGGDGTFDGISDPVPVPSLPSIGATDTGFISLFVPSASQIKQVSSYLWSNLFDLATFKKIFEDPMDCILGLSVVPVSVPTSGSAQLTVGNVELSGISLPLASQQYVEIDCGTVDFTNRYFGSYLDFEPYTKMSLFVPYSGVHAVSADDIIGKVVGLKYHIDILTGSLVAFLTCGSSVLYEFNGACASNIPVNSMNYASTIENAIRIAVNIGTTVATAGAAAPATAAGEGSKLAISGAEVGRAIALGGSTAQGALSLKPSIDRAGSLGGTTGLMGNQIPYFIITRPRMCKPKNQDVFQGYPSFIQTTLGDMEGTGFTAFENVILAGSYLTDAEKRELESILTTGVYL